MIAPKSKRKVTYENKVSNAPKSKRKVTSENKVCNSKRQSIFLTC